VELQSRPAGFKMDSPGGFEIASVQNNQQATDVLPLADYHLQPD